MICKVRQTIEKYSMLSGVKAVAVGVSGGADSMCLLEILSKLKQEYDIILKAVHINHNIRGKEALRDQTLVEDYCRKIGIECTVFSVDIPALSAEMGIGEEECGRIKRYECFSKVGCDCIATAHTLSDSIETMMFNLIRGTGTKGLCGIPAVRDNIVRPLIDCSRAEIEAYCCENDIPYVIDSTNLTDDYTRNFIRHNIVGRFSRINENYFSAVAGAMETLRAENDFLEKCKNELLVTARVNDSYNASSFADADPAVRRRAIADILAFHMQKDVEKRHIDLVDNAIVSGEGKIEIAKDLYVTVKNDAVSFERDTIPQDKWEAICKDNQFITPFGNYTIEEASSAECRNVNAFDADKIIGNLHMSSRREGDVFYSKKRNNTKTLKKLFNEESIPAHERNNIAILRDEKSVVWIDGFGTDGKYLPDINTKNVLIIKKDG